MNKVILTGIFIINPAIVLTVYALNTYTNKLATNKYYKNVILRTTINVFLLLTVLLLVAAIVAILTLLDNTFKNIDVIYGIIFIGVSAALPILLALYSIKGLITTSNYYKSKKYFIYFKIFIILYTVICFSLIFLSIYSIYSGVMGGANLPGIVLLLGPSLYVSYPIVFGFLVIFIMKFHQYLNKRNAT